MSTRYNHASGRVEIARRSLTVGLGALLIAPVALAQGSSNATAPGDAGELKPVALRTGSHIPTAETETASPVTVYTAAEIERRGITTMNELLQRSPLSSQGSLVGNNEGTGFASGGTGTSLRGLGLNATLVLLNGRRLPLYGFANGGTDTFVDLNGISMAAVESVEILREGASAIYGADAVAGVINIKTKKDFDGLIMKAYYGNTFSSDTGEQKYDITYGTHSKDDKSRVLLVADYRENNALFNRDRAFSSQVDLRPLGGINNGSSYGYPGRFVVPRTAPGLAGTPFAGASGTRTLVAPRNTDGKAAPGAYHTFSDDDRFNFLNYSQATTPRQQYGVFGNIEHDLFDEKMQAFVQFSGRRVEVHEELAPTPVDFAGTGSGLGIPAGQVVYKNGVKIVGNQVTIPKTNPFNPFGVDITAGRYRFLEAGNRTSDITTHAYDFVGGLRGKLDDRLEYETAFNYGRGDTTKNNLGININSIQSALNKTDPTQALNVFNGPGSPNSQSVINGLKVRSSQQAYYETLGWDGRLSGLIDLEKIVPADKVGYSVGAEYRTEQFADIPDEIQKAGAIAGQVPLLGNSGSRDVTSAYVESRIPITSPNWNMAGFYRLDITAAGRLDSYNDAGSSAVPAVRIAWRPVNEEFLLRGSYGQSFRPASLQQLFNTPQDALTSSFTDPLRGELVREIPISRGGNPKLEPETSDSWTAGFVYSPHFVRGLTVDSQWVQIKRRNEIGSYSDFFGNGALAERAGGYVRGPYDGLASAKIDPATGALAGPLISLNDQFQNLGSTVMDAIDGGVHYELPTETAGRWFAGVELSYLLSYRASAGAGEPYSYYQGEATGSDAFPKWKAVFDVGWEYRNLTLSAIAYFRNGIHYTNPATDEAARVSSFTTYDVTASYKFPKDAKVTVGIRNLLDTDPPLYLGLSNNSFAYLSTVDSPLGRSYFVEVSKKF